MDESFLKVGSGDQNCAGNVICIAEKIKDDLEREFQLPCAVGIGPNMLMAKLCLDLDAKKQEIEFLCGRMKIFQKKSGQFLHFWYMWGLGVEWKKN